MAVAASVKDNYNTLWLTEQRHKHVEDGEDRGGRDEVLVKKNK